MLAGHAIRLAILIALALLAQVQLTISQRTQMNRARSSKIESFSEDTRPMEFDLPLPIVNQSAPQKDVEWAVKFLKLPVWSHAYVSCDSPESEVSCFEVVRAAKAIDNYHRNARAKFTEGAIYVEFPPENPIPLEDKMSMIYHGFQIALATGRQLFTNITAFPFKFPNDVLHSSVDPQGYRLPYDFQFGCAPVGKKTPKLVLRGPTWPQALYTHPIIAPYLRDTFSFHAAYFIGNYLFGSAEPPSAECKVALKTPAVEGWRFFKDNDMARPTDYQHFIPRCGVSVNAAMITNDNESNFGEDHFQDRYLVKSEDDSTFVCGLNKLISSTNIVHTFGSRLGWWASAMQGKKGGFLNGIDRICVNMNNSQQGSLWHTFCPVEKSWIWRTNNRLYVCGPNINDVRLYLDYLLW